MKLIFPCITQIDEDEVGAIRSYPRDQRRLIF